MSEDRLVERDVRLKRALAYDRFRKLLIVLGSILVLLGFGLLLYSALVVMKVLQEPQAVPVFQYISQLVNVDGAVIKGKMTMLTMNGPQDVQFEFEIAPEIKKILFLISGAFIVTLMVTAIKMIVDGGVAMIKGGLYRSLPKKKS